MKKLLLIGVISFLTIGVFNILFLHADSPERKFIEFNEASNIMIVDSHEVEMDISPSIINDKFMIPVRFLTTGLNGSLDWDSAEQKATVRVNSTEIVVWADKKSFVLNGDTRQLDVAPVIVNNRMLIPARGIFENLGYKVTWNPQRYDCIPEKGSVYIEDSRGYDKAGDFKNNPPMYNATKVLDTTLYDFAIKSDGTLWEWQANGLNVFPEKINGITDVKDMDMIFYDAKMMFVYAITNDGSAWMWDNTRVNTEDYYYVLKNENERPTKPIKISTISDVKAIKGITDNIPEGVETNPGAPYLKTYLIFLKNDGSVWMNCYHRNNSGVHPMYKKYLDEEDLNRVIPIKIEGLEGIVSIYSNFDSNIFWAIKNDGTMYKIKNNFLVESDRIDVKIEKVEELSNVKYVRYLDDQNLFIVKNDGTLESVCLSKDSVNSNYTISSITKFDVVKDVKDAYCFYYNEVNPYIIFQNTQDAVWKLELERHEDKDSGLGSFTVKNVLPMNISNVKQISSTIISLPLILNANGLIYKLSDYSLLPEKVNFLPEDNFSRVDKLFAIYDRAIEPIDEFSGSNPFYYLFKSNKESFIKELSIYPSNKISYIARYIAGYNKVDADDNVFMEILPVEQVLADLKKLKEEKVFNSDELYTLDLIEEAL